MGSVFLLLYLPWPIRNYVNHDRIVLVTSPASGYIRYAADVRAFRSWLFTWHPSDWQPYFDEILYGEGEVEFPDWVFASEEEKQLAADMVNLCRECGSGFYAWKHREPIDFPDCNDEIRAGFRTLRVNFKNHQPWVYYFAAPMKSVSKSFFNLQIQSHENQNRYLYRVFQGFFVYRGVLMILALSAGFYLLIRKRNIEAGFLISFPVFMILFLSFYLRQVEMRYLLQAEVFMIPLLSIILQRLMHKSSAN